MFDLIEIQVEGKTSLEVLDEINDAKKGHDPMWLPEMRLLAGRFKEPVHMGGRYVASVVPGDRLFGVLVV